MRFYTHHDELIELPDFSGESIHSLDSLMETFSLRYVIIDSIFSDNLNVETVIDQDPKPNTFVKENRRVYLTVVAKNKKLVVLPNLIDLTKRRAISKLKSLGLIVGELSFVPDMAKNAVLKQLVDGKELESGVTLPTGTTVDLVIGDGLSDLLVELPLLEGLTLEDATLVLQMSSLNVGLAVFDENVKDSTTAIIYSQRPKAAEDKMINLGRNVDVFLKIIDH
jgi:beta-lactam-binding protein with PASTA domain